MGMLWFDTEQHKLDDADFFPFDVQHASAKTL
jgi:hypothetical protein